MVKRLLIALAVLVICIGGSCAALVGWRLFRNHQDETAAAAATAADPKLQRPLASTDGQIAFVVQQRGTDDIYAVGLDGSEPVRLTHLPSGAIISQRPVWSPDGNSLAFSVGTNGDPALHVLEVDASSSPRLIRERSHAPAWSPDGQRLAFLSQDHVYVAAADGSGPSDLSQGWPPLGDDAIYELAWSPDGQRLALLRTTRIGGRRRTSNLYVAQTDGSGLANLTGYDDSINNSMEGLVWSPDGQQLAMSMHRNGWSILTIKVDGAERAEFGRNGLLVSQYPAWSHDGTRLAWSNARSIVVSEPNGDGQRQLTFGRGSAFAPTWSPDGTRIAFIREHQIGELWAMNEDGSGLTRLTTLHARTPVWRPSRSGG